MRVSQRPVTRDVRTRRKTMETILTTYATADIPELIALDQSGKCTRCTQEERDCAHDILACFAYWWLSPELRDSVGTRTFLEGKQSADFKSMSILFKFDNPNHANLRSGFAILSQHDWSGIHFQLQVPHGDLGVRLKDRALASTIETVIASCDRETLTYREKGKKSISLHSPLGDTAMLTIQRAMGTLVREVLSACK